MTSPARPRPRRRALLGGLLAASAVLIASPAVASAASVAYIDGGEVWVASLDGATKVRLSAGEGTWREVAAADDGVVAATSRVDAGIFRAAMFRTWSPGGVVTHDGGLTAPNGWLTYVYPLSFDISGDGNWLTYGYSQTNGFGMQQTFETGHYVRNVAHGFIDPYKGPTGREWPTFGPGNRIIASQGSAVTAQAADAAPFTTTFDPWFDTSGTGLDVSRIDVAASGTLAAFEADRWTGGTRTTARIGVVSVTGVGGTLTGAVDCWLPASGLASDVSISQDGTRIAWHDARGVVVAGAPVGSADPCALSSPAVVISATGTGPSIGGADAAAILAARTPPPAGPAPGGGTPGGGAPAPGGPSPASGGTPAPSTGTVPLAVSAPALRAAVLTARRGAAVAVTAPAAGRLTVVATVPAARLGGRGAPVVVARGAATAAAAGTVSVRVRPTAAGTRAARRLKGARITLAATQGTRTARAVIVLR